MNAKTFDVPSEISTNNISTLVDLREPKEIEEIYKLKKGTSNIINTYKKGKRISTYISLTTKRIVDIIGSIIGIITLIPLTVIVATCNFINKDFGPVFYSHRRIGKNGKYFKMYKFRTMIVDADKKLKDLLKNDEKARREWEESRKLKNDPRITKIGKFLRKTSLDEWPQFLCVFMRNNEYCWTKGCSRWRNRKIWSI